MKHGTCNSRRALMNAAVLQSGYLDRNNPPNNFHKRKLAAHTTALAASLSGDTAMPVERNRVQRRIRLPAFSLPAMTTDRERT